MDGPASHRRRQALRAGVGLLFAGITQPAFARLESAQVRTLAFDNLHTGERLKVDYWVEGQYRPEALGAVNHMLRDFRANEVHPIDVRLLDLLDALHRRLGGSASYQVISGYRSPKTNAMLRTESSGVAKNSLHTKGMAIDIRLADRTLRDLRAAALSLRLGGVGYYPHSDFVHVDVGRVRSW